MVYKLVWTYTSPFQVSHSFIYFDFNIKTWTKWNEIKTEKGHLETFCLFQIWRHSFFFHHILFCVNWSSVQLFYFLFGYFFLFGILVVLFFLALISSMLYIYNKYKRHNARPSCVDHHHPDLRWIIYPLRSIIRPYYY